MRPAAVTLTITGEAETLGIIRSKLARFGLVPARE